MHTFEESFEQWCARRDIGKSCTCKHAPSEPWNHAPGCFIAIAFDMWRFVADMHVSMWNTIAFARRKLDERGMAPVNVSYRFKEPLESITINLTVTDSIEGA